MKRIYLILSAILLLKTSIIAQVGIAAGATISQDFDTMSDSAIATLPMGWKADTNASPGIVGLYASASTTTRQVASASLSPTAAGGIYNFGAGNTSFGDSDRCVGGLTSSTVKAVNIYVGMINSGTTSISSLVISYDIEKYKTGTNSAGFIVQLCYSIDGASWITPNLNFTTPFSADATNTGYPVVPGGNNSIASQTLTLISPVAPGGHIYLAWNYSIASGNTGTDAQALGIDDVSITAVGATPSPFLSAGMLSSLGSTCTDNTVGPNSFTLTGINLDGTKVYVVPFAGYSFSTSATGSYSSQLTLSYSGPSLDTVVYVKFAPGSAQSYNGSIAVTGGGTNGISVPVTGTGLSPLLMVATGSAGSITQSSAILNGSITSSGCSSIASYGIEYSTVNGFLNNTGTKVPSSNLNGSSFSSNVSGLSSTTMYYYHAYAINSSSIAYGGQRSFTTSSPGAPVADPATNITNSSFIANWEPSESAVNYRLDIATTNTFITPDTTTLVNWNFPSSTNDSIVDVASALNTNQTITTMGTTSPPSFSAGATGANTNVAMAKGWTNGSGTKYWQIGVNTTGYYNLLLSSKQRSSSAGPRDFKVQYRLSASPTWLDVPSGIVLVKDNFTTGALYNLALPNACNNQDAIFIRWLMTSDTSEGGGMVATTGVQQIDDILVTGNPTSCISGYQDTLVKNTSQLVTGLLPTTTYYYRIRAFDGNAVGANSNIITVTTFEASPLPVSLISFAGVRKDNSNLLSWKTTSETNNKGFEVQRSGDGILYQPISFIPSSAPGGNSQGTIDYTFNDYDFTGDKQFYRLEQVDNDGKLSFSPTIIIQDQEIKTMNISDLYPNPATANINLTIDAPNRQRFTCSIIDNAGHILKQMVLDLEEGSNSYKFAVSDLPAGTYYFKIVNSTGTTFTRRFLVQ